MTKKCRCCGEEIPESRVTIDDWRNAAYTKILTQQNIYDKFYFLEGLVNEHTYIEIAETAIGIYDQARTPIMEE